LIFVDRRPPDKDGIMSVRRILLFLSLAWFTAWAHAGYAPPTATVATAFKVLVDSNIYLQSEAPLAAGQTSATLPAEAGDAVVVVRANFGVTGQTAAGLKMEASYAPEILRFSRYTTESHDNHWLAFNLTGHSPSWSLEVKNSILFTHGSKDPPVFNRLGGGPALGGEPVRARRAQTVAKAGWRLTHLLPSGFVRGVFNLLDQDFHVRESPVLGCANYVDRREWYTGAEAGWCLHPGFAMIGAVRVGRQTQANLLGTDLHYSNAFTRWLVGVEGSPRADLKLSLLAGPDVRCYAEAVRPDFEREQTTTYVEGSATWVASKSDTVTLGLRRWQWLNGGGRGAYLDLSIDAGWKHVLAPGWTLAASANLHQGWCTRYNPASPRDDLIYTGNLTVSRALSPGTSLDVGVMHDWSDSRVVGAPSREYSRWILSAGGSRVW
jgi:hypothetical protein